MNRELLQQALDALERMDKQSPYPVEPRLVTALREALAAPPAATADMVMVPREPTHEMLYAMAELDGWRKGDRDHPMFTRWRDYWNAALTAAPAPAVPADPWKVVIDDELVCFHIGTADSFPDAKVALKSFIDWHVSVALDPAVSSNAQALIDKGRSVVFAVWEPLTDEQFNDLVMEHLGPHALTGGKMSVYGVFLLAVRATERTHGIGGGGK